MAIWGKENNRWQRPVNCSILNAGRVTKSSSLYETAAWGKTNQPAFLNQALEIETVLNAKQLIRHILKVEKKMGRVREEKYGERMIDIDIIFFNNEIHKTTFLEIPHPEMQNRRFVLVPLAEIIPTAVHPVFLKTVAELLEDCADKLEVKRIAD
ncbi:MAG: 2-amino-4-hydroxy-6-hydroxymethyldihydropteridine diphosphokinase [Bacteroidota bacterium]